MKSDVERNDYLATFNGSFSSALRWPQFDALWARARDNPEGWYVYDLAESPPTHPLEPEAFLRFSAELEQLLRREHDEDYCGIVYADDLETPTMVKVYDPHNLGMVCGSSTHPPLPGWVLSRLLPIDLPAARRPPPGRVSWWRRIFGSGL
jgi:hypothetical protein